MTDLRPGPTGTGPHDTRRPDPRQPDSRQPDSRQPDSRQYDTQQVDTRQYEARRDTWADTRHRRDPLFTEQPMHLPPPRRVWLWHLGNGFAWLGGADWRELGDRSERSVYQLSGFFVALNALIAGAMMTFAAVGAASVPPAQALPVTLLWGLFVGAFDRSISAKIVDPTAKRGRGTGGFLVRALFTVVLGVLVAEAAALTIFASSIERTLNDNINGQITTSQLQVTGADGQPTTRQAELDRLRAERTGLDTAVDTAQQKLNDATTLALCEREPGPGCEDVVITGRAGPGEQTARRERELESAQRELDAAEGRRATQAPVLDEQVVLAQQELDRDRARAAELARAEAGVDARWKAMHDYTVSSPAALALRAGLSIALIFLDLVPLLLKVLRGQSTHDQRVLAGRQRGARALAEHTGRFTERLKHESDEHTADLAERTRAGEVERSTRLQKLLKKADVDVRIDAEKQDRRLADAVEAIRSADPIVADDDAPGPGGPVTVSSPPGPAAEIPEWWNERDRQLIGMRFGPYEAVAALADADRGGFGRLLIARHHADHSDRVVIKAVAEPVEEPRRVRRAGLRSPRQSSVRRMWDAEIRTAQLLRSHAAVAEVLDHGHDHGYLWIASRLYAPGSLVRWVAALDSRQALTLEDTFTVVKQVVEALRFAHSRGLTHGDIKPHNVVLHGIRVRLLDWGLARAVGVAGAEVSGIRPAGTRFYTAPEAFLGTGSGDQLADLYSLGATWYYLLTGHAPGADVLEDWPERPPTVRVAMLVLDGELVPSPLLRLLPALPDEVAALVHRLLAAHPADRAPDADPSSAASDLAEEIIELEGRLTVTQKRLPVGDHAVVQLSEHRALPPGGPGDGPDDQQHGERNGAQHGAQNGEVPARKPGPRAAEQVTEDEPDEVAEVDEQWDDVEEEDEEVPADTDPGNVVTLPTDRPRPSGRWDRRDAEPGGTTQAEPDDGS